MLKPMSLIRESFCCPLLSFKRQIDPTSEQTIASFSVILATQVNMLLLKLPNRQFLPGSAMGVWLAGSVGDSMLKRCFDGEFGAAVASLQTLTCLVPTLKYASWLA